MIDVFCFPDNEIQLIYDYYQIEKCFLYQNLTDTDSTSLFFTFIGKPESFVAESEARNIIFKCLKKSKILKRLDLSDDFWKKFDVYDHSTKKQMGLYEIENISNQNIEKNIATKNYKIEKYNKKWKPIEQHLLR